MGTKNRNCTKFFSNAQEEKVAKLVNGKVVAGSGSPHFCAGDVITEDWLFECKCPMTERQSFSLKKEWFIKNEREKQQLLKPYSGIVFQFAPNTTNYVVIDEKTFKLMYEIFENYGKENA